jgi:DNA-binding response OmpR family regulator
VKSRILVVDDNHDVCQTVADMLGMTGAQVLTAFNGTDAVGVLEKNAIDLAIVDLLFAGPISSELVVQLAKMKQCPVITMSGTLSSDRRGRDLGTPASRQALRDRAIGRRRRDDARQSRPTRRVALKPLPWPRRAYRKLHSATK